MTIRELIEVLEKIEKESNKAKHGEPRIDVSLCFEDEELDARFFDGELVEIEEHYRLNCMCVDGVNLVIKVKEFGTGKQLLEEKING